MRNKKLIQLYLTNMCNSRCKTCSIWKNTVRKEIYSGYVYKMIKAFPDADYVIGGGEAILHKGIEKILHYMQIMEINYTLLSNCIMPKRLMMLVEEYNVPAVTISCDGINHDEIRGCNGNLANIIEFKEWCDLNNIRMKISYTYSKYNEVTFKEDMKFFKEKLGFNEIYFCIAQDMELLMTIDINESFVASDFEQILDCDLISEKDKRHVKGMISGVRRRCTSQNNVHTVYSNGDIVRCQSFRCREVIGNIGEMTVEEIRRELNSIYNDGCPFDVDCNLLCQRRYD